MSERDEKGILPEEAGRIPYAAEEASPKVYDTNPGKLDRLTENWGPEEFEEYIRYDGCFCC